MDPEQTNNPTPNPIPNHTYAFILILHEVERLAFQLQNANRGIEDEWVYKTVNQIKSLTHSYHTLKGSPIDQS